MRETIALFRRPKPAPPLPIVVEWTGTYLVRDGQPWAREALVILPGETSPRRMPVKLAPAVAA
jgi:hypothetical protein